jgi:two-component system response regulator VanR
LPAFPATFAPSAGGTILIVKHNLDSERELCDTLRGAGYVVEVIQDDKVECVLLADVAIVLLVASDSDVPIYDICLAIKRKKPILPIIVIGPDDAPTKLRFFSLGADDYVLRSFDRLELVARVKSQIRRRRKSL